MIDVVSIIMPVFNTKEFLFESISSVLKQTYQNFELILINDNSTDGSLEICKKFALLDSRIILLNNFENIGPSKTRNKGIRKAKGKYITFIDADDIYSETFIKELVTNLENNCAEISVVDYTYDLSSINNIKNINVKRHTSDYFIREICLNRKFKGFVWNKLYIKSIIDNNHIQFDENLTYCEDYFFNLRYLECIETCVESSKTLYYYRQVQNSLSHSKAIEKEIKLISILGEKKDFYLRNGKTKFAANLEMLICEKAIKLNYKNIKNIKIKTVLQSDLFFLNKIFMILVEKCKLSRNIYILLLKIEYKIKLLK